VCVSNFASVPHSDVRLGLPSAGAWHEVVNTDAATYTGSGVGNLGVLTAEEGGESGQPAHATLVLPPLATVWLRQG
jgi:1,4-alpha-glucan branching enzyme